MSDTDRPQSSIMSPFWTLKRIPFIALVITVLTIVAILLVLFLHNYPTFAKREVVGKLVFKNGTFSMERFITTADLVNLQMAFYIYNITNPHQVLNSSEPINLEKLGPFVYHEFRWKEFLDNNQTSGLITFKLRRRFRFMPELSNGDPSRMITWINLPLIVVRSYLDKLPFFERIGLYGIFEGLIKYHKEGPFLQDSIENLLFNGSQRNFFYELKLVNEAVRYLKPWPLKDNKFGLLYGKNNTWDPARDHILTVAAGFGINRTYSDLNQYVLMNGSAQMSNWKDRPGTCNIVQGTDGEFFAPFANKSENVEVLALDLCRRLSFKYRHDTDIFGVRAGEYTLDERTLQSGSKNQDNICYCLAPNGLPSRECALDGLIDLRTCGFPNIYASGANFWTGSPELFQGFTGLSPPDSSNEPVILIEPNTGLALKVAVPMQFNVKLESGGFSIFNFINSSESIFLPVVSIFETSSMTEEQSHKLKRELLILDSWLVTMVLGGSIIVIMAIVVGASIVCVHLSKRRSQAPRETDPLIGPDEEQTDEQNTSQP